MLNKQKEKPAWITVCLPILIILAGIALIVHSFSETRAALSQERHDHLLDIAWSADCNISNLLGRCRSEIEFAVDNCASQEANYRSTGDRTAMLAYMEEMHIMQFSYVSSLLLLDGPSLLLCTPQKPPDYYSFPYGDQNQPFFLCTDQDGTSYLAVAVSSECGLTYAVLICLEDFYSMVLGEELSQTYWMGLYYPDGNLMMQNDSRITYATSMSQEEALKHKSALSILVKSELAQEIVTKAYVLENETLGIREGRLVATIPTGSNHNGEFAVAVSVNSKQYIDLIRNLIWQIICYALLILLALCVLLVHLLRNHRKNAEIREHVALLEEQNKATQELLDKTRELAHHQRLEMIGTMTSSIAHEFNNLLTPIMGYSLMTMERLPEGDELFDNVAEIYEASYRAKSLVARLSALSRKNSEVTARLLSPDAVLEKVLEIAQPSRPRKVTVERDFHCEAACLMANETQLAQLALNIVINAFQAMEGNGGTLTVATEQEEASVVLTFRDTGPGIPADVLEHIFEPFYTTKELGRGTGLGLAIVKQTVEAHNGEITAESTVGQGTTFRVCFPLAVAEGKPDAPLPEPPTTH